jgi:hypothetical protein
MARALLAGAVALAALLAAAGCTSATPGGPAGHRSMPYDVSWTLVSGPLATCVTFTAAGDLTYTLGGGQYAGVTLTSPQLRASVSRYDAATRRCAGHKALSGLSMAQHWAGYACGFNPPIAAPATWQASDEAWPGCLGDRDQALMITTYNVSSSSYNQYNSGSPLPLGTFGAGDGTAGPCFGVYATATLSGHDVSDSLTAGSYQSARKVCLPAA